MPDGACAASLCGQWTGSEVSGPASVDESCCGAAAGQRKLSEGRRGVPLSRSHSMKPKGGRRAAADAGAAVCST